MAAPVLRPGRPPFVSKGDFARRFLAPMLIVLAPLITVGIASIASFRERLREDTAADISVFLEDRFDIINNYIMSIKRTAYEFAHVPEVPRLLSRARNAEEDREDVTASIRKYADRVFYQEGWFFTNLVLLDDSLEPRFRFNPRTYPFDLANLMLIRSARRGVQSIDGPFQTGNSDILLVASPVFDDSNRHLGIAVLEVDFAKFVEKAARINQLSRFANGLFTSSGKVITKTGHETVASLRDLRDVAPWILPTGKTDARRGGHEIAIIGGIPQLFVYQPFPASDWYLFGAMPMDAVTRSSDIAAGAIVALVAFAAIISAMVLVRTGQLRERNARLSLALDDLSRAREALLRHESSAAANALLARIAHSLNTPLGNAITAATHAKALATSLAREMADERPRRSVLSETVCALKELADSQEQGLRTASEQLSRFKRIAMDESTHGERAFEVHRYLRYCVDYLDSRPSGTGIDVTIARSRPFSVLHAPGDWSEMLSLLVDVANSVRRTRSADDSLSIELEPLSPERVELRAHYRLRDAEPPSDSMDIRKPDHDPGPNPLRSLSILLESRMKGALKLERKGSLDAFSLRVIIQVPVSFFAVDSEQNASGA